MPDNTKANYNEFLSDDDIDRLVEDIPEPGKGPSGKPIRGLLTVGFTIKNCAKLIGESLDDRGVLGWFVHMPPAEEKTSQKLSLSKLVIRRQNGELRLGTAPMVGPDGESLINFKVFAQNPEPDFPDANTNAQNAASTYAQSLAYTAGQLYPSPSAQVKDLSNYTNWSGACFFRRSDLKFMQLLLLAQADKYNDLFFSGAKTRYDIMHNPRLRVEQFTREDANGTIIPDPGKAFTMKAEPVSNPDETIPSGNAMIDLLGATTDTDYSQQGATSGNEMFPGAVMASPCPPYWGLIQEIGANLNLNTTKAAEKLMSLLSQLDDFIDSNDLEKSSIPISDIINAEDRNWLYDILTFFINLFTKWRDGGTN